MKSSFVLISSAIFSLLLAIPAATASDIQFKPIGRATTNWSTGSNKSGQFDFNKFDFDAVDLGAKIKFDRRFSIKVHAVLNEDDVKFKDVYVEVPLGKVRYIFGHSKVPNFFNWHVQGKNKTFIERPTLRRAFGGARKFGLRVASNGDDWGWTAGVFKGDLNETIGSSDWTVAARGYRGFTSGDTNWFLGVSARYRSNEPERLSYGDRPYTFAVGKQFKYRGDTSDMMVAGEIAFQQGPLYGVVEGAFLRAGSVIIAGQNDALFGGYAEVGYNITGEETRFDFKRGAFGQTRVANPVTKGGAGLWQVSVRYDVLDTSGGSLASNNLNGGLQKSIIGGVNWQATKHIRLLANYSRASISRTIGGNDSIDAFGMRLIFML